MLAKYRKLWVLFILLAITISGCSSKAPETVSYPNQVIPSSSPAPALATKQAVPTVSPAPTFNVNTPFPTLPWPSPTATYDPNNMPPELLYTATPDLNALTISARLDPGLSREEITRMLFTKWMDHFLSDSMSLEWRLSNYTIDSVLIPADQTCAEKLGALFMAEAVVTAETVLPAFSTTSNSSDWMSAGGGPIAETETQRTMRFISAVRQQNNEYLLEVIMRAPICEP